MSIKFTCEIQETNRPTEGPRMEFTMIEPNPESATPAERDAFAFFRDLMEQTILQWHAQRKGRV